MHAATASNFVKQRHRTWKVFLKTNAPKMFILHTLLLNSSKIFKVSSKRLRHIRKIIYGNKVKEEHVKKALRLPDPVCRRKGGTFVTH